MSERLEVKVEQSEVERQKEFINKIKIMNNMDYEQGAEQKYFVVHTYGCQMNARDSEKLIGMLVEMGYQQNKNKTKTRKKRKKLEKLRIKNKKDKTRQNKEQENKKNSREEKEERKNRKKQNTNTEEKTRTCSNEGI